MALIILYNLFKYIKALKNYKKMAKEDKAKLLEYLNANNIRREEFGDNSILINNFIITRIEHHNITSEEYINYVFPYLQRYLKRDKFLLKKEENNINASYWKEI